MFFTSKYELESPPSSSPKKNHHKTKKNRAVKINLVFDEAKRRDFLTGFHKRKLQRKKAAREKLEQELKQERKRLKSEAKDSYKKLVLSSRPIPELETLLKEEYEDDEATVRIEELSTNSIAQQSSFIGANRLKFEESKASDEDESDDENEVPGMELVEKKGKKSESVQQQFDSERDVKRLLKKEATKKVKKSKVFQMKNKIEKQKQKKKSMQQKKQRIRIKEKMGKKRKH